MATHALTFAKLIALTVVLNIVRYVVGGPIEAVTIMEPMHRVLPLYPAVFNNDFSGGDFAVSFFYNFVMWFAVVLAVHLMWPALRGGPLARSAKGYGAMLLFYAGLAAIYMNHYVADVQSFYFWSIVDAVILFPIVAVAHAFLYPRLFKDRGGA